MQHLHSQKLYHHHVVYILAGSIGKGQGYMITVTFLLRSG